MRLCPFNDCPKTLPDHLFACRPHWFSLDAHDKAMIHSAYGDYQAGEIDGETLRDRQQAVLGERGDSRRSDGEAKEPGARG